MTTRSLTSSSDQRSSFGLITTALFLLIATHACNGAYYGKLIGKLSEFHHGVSGEVYAVDGRTLFIKDFTYDGEGPTAYFYVGTTKNVNGNGIRVRDEHGTTNVLKRYRKKGITLTLPEGRTLNNIKWFSVWCDEFAVNFGDVKIPRGFDYPKPQKLDLLNGIHGVSSEPVVIVDAQTLLIPSFSYDGEAPDAKFWAGSGSTPSSQGIRIPDENGNVRPLRRYDHKTIVLTLPGDLTVHQIGHFGVWCEAFAVDFGHIQIPPNVEVPPSLKMLGVSPQNVHLGGQGQTVALGTQNLHGLISPSSLPGSSSSGSKHTLPVIHQQHGNQAPTTYRPLLRRDDRIQVVQAVDYRVPKSLEAQQNLPRQIQWPQASPLVTQERGDFVDSQQSTQLRLEEHPVFSQRRYDGPPSTLQGRSLEPPLSSYARQMRFQGNRRIDSFVRY